MLFFSQAYHFLLHHQLLFFVTNIIWLSSNSFCSWEDIPLTVWGQNKMADILQTTFLNAVSCKKIFYQYSNFSGVCSQVQSWQASIDWFMHCLNDLRPRLLSSYGGLALNRPQAITRISDGSGHWHINGSVAWISNHMPSKVWDVITYPFPNFNSSAVEVWERISNFIPHFIMDAITYPCRN